MALGAQRRDVLRLVLQQGMKPVAFGSVAGLAGSLAASRLVASQLYGVSSSDPLTLASIIVLLAPPLCSPAGCPRAARRGSIRWRRCAASEWWMVISGGKDWIWTDLRKRKNFKDLPAGSEGFNSSRTSTC